MQTHDSLDVAQPVRIMALGDSVTVMLPDQNYRERLAASCRAVGYNVNFVGAIGVDKLTTLTSRHSAISGITAAEVDTHYIDSWMDLAEPDIVLMLLGANDIQGAQRSPEDTIDSLRSIILKMRITNPSIRVFLGMYPPIRPDLPDMATMIAMIPALAEELHTTASPVTAVDHAPDFDIRIGADHIDLTHPNLNGDRKYAYNWFAAFVREGLCSAQPVLVNATAGKPVNADSVDAGDASTLLSHLVNGNIQDNLYWARNTTQDVIISIDLQGEYLISYLELSHCSSWIGIAYDVEEPHPWNTRSYVAQLRSSKDAPWITVGTATDNEQGRTAHLFAPLPARYFQLLLHAPESPSTPLVLRQISIFGVPLSVP